MNGHGHLVKQSVLTNNTGEVTVTKRQEKSTELKIPKFSSENTTQWSNKVLDYQRKGSKKIYKNFIDMELHEVQRERVR
jgi:hypothetical protein